MEGLSVTIRPEEKDDIPEIRSVLINAFEQEDEAELVDRIRHSKYFIPRLSLVAEYEGSILGHILFSSIWITNDSSRFSSLALAPVSVHPDYQQQGIGGKLIMRGLFEATNLGHASVILLGHADYYPRFGFEPSATWDISPPFEVPDENFMALELVPEGLRNKSGTVVYPDVWNLGDQSQ